MSLFKYISSFLNSNDTPNTLNTFNTSIEAKYIENIDKKNQYDSIQLTIKTGDCVLVFNIDVLNTQIIKSITYLKNLLENIHDQSMYFDYLTNDEKKEVGMEMGKECYVICEGDYTCFFRQHLRVSFESKNNIVLSATSENRCGCDFRVIVSKKCFFEQMHSMINKMEEFIN